MGRGLLDRILIAQAVEIGGTAVTDDPHWKKYPVKLYCHRSRAVSSIG